ncbi:MAG: FG-GAP-like repeat-containing protein [Terriglobales bacterium]
MACSRSCVRAIAFIARAVLILAAANLLAQSVNPVPFVNQPLVPTSVAPGSPEFALTVNGTGFVSTSVVKWNGAALGTAFVNSHQLVADVPASALTSAHTASVTVFSPTPGGGTSNVDLFTITNPTTTLAFTTSTIPTGLNPGGIVAADFNNDGKPDLAFVNQDQPDSTCYTPGYDGLGTISVLLGNGDGGFSNKSTVCFPDNLGMAAGEQLGIANFANGNAGLLGVFDENGGEGSFSAIFSGNGDGTFNCCTELGGFDGPAKMITADFNRDGYIDLAFPAVDDESGEGNTYVFLGPDFSDGGGCCFEDYFDSVATGDFNNDGILDLALVGGSGVKIALGNGDGTFTVDSSQPSVNLVDPSSVITADFNGDGILDLAIADAGSSALTILKGNGDGTFTQVAGEPSLPGFTNSVTSYDFNGDGKLDLLFSSAENTFSIYLGNGDGTFQPALVQSMPYAPYGVAVGDFNGDGRLDLALTNSANNTVSILLQTTTRPRRASITVASSQNPSYVNEPVTYVAVVSGGKGTPTGSVTFTQGAIVLGTVPLTDGQASITTTLTEAAKYSVFATYTGDQNYRPRVSKEMQQVVNKYSTSVNLYSSADPSTQGQPVTFTAAVNTLGPQPAGKVVFFNGSTPMGFGNLIEGSAMLTKSHLPAGTLSITATYDGDMVLEKSTSTVWLQVVN